jgi:hypothetical protein
MRKVAWFVTNYEKVSQSLRGNAIRKPHKRTFIPTSPLLGKVGILTNLQQGKWQKGASALWR